MDTQPQFTPEQKAKVKKAKIILWLGITTIIVIGLLIAVYFVFVREAVAPTVNDTDSNQTAVNTNTTTLNSRNDNQTYVNSKYKYSVTVPKDWAVNTEGLCGDNRVGFASEPFECSPDGYSGAFSITVSTGDKSLAQIKADSPDMNFTETTIGGQPALQYLYQFTSEYLGGEFTRTGYMLVYKGNTFTIGEELAGQESGPTDELIQFAQSFKFL